MATINSDGFILSSAVRVYPCAYRDSTVDLKSRVNLEENIIRSALRGTGSYLLQFSSTIKCFIKGYYFEFDVDDVGDYIGLKLNVAATTDDFKAAVLTPFDGSAGDCVDQKDSSGVLWFKAVKFLKSGTCDLYFEEAENVKPVSYESVASSYGKLPITGNLTNGSGYGSIQQVNAWATNDAKATGENSVAFGEGTTADQKNEVAIGAYNAAGATGEIFSIGTGTGPSDRHSLVRVNSTPNVTLGPKGSVSLSGANLAFGQDCHISGLVNFSDANVKFAGNAIAITEGCTVFTSATPMKITATTESTSKATGALTVAGGVGIGGTLNVGEKATFGGQIQAASFYATSDERKKRNIDEYSCENSILDLPVKQFDMKSDGTHHIGCIAQDLQKICPEIVHEDADGYLSIEESKLSYLLLGEIKKLREEIDELKNKLK